MFRRLLIVAALLVSLLSTTTASVVADLSPSPCEQTGFFGGIEPLSSLSFDVTCAQTTTVYFGICDANATDLPEGLTSQSLFELKDATGHVLSFNRFSGDHEYVLIGSAQLSPGLHTLTAYSLNPSNLIIVGFEASISSDRAWVTRDLAFACGPDYAVTTSSICTAAVPVFTVDAAPVAGELRFDVQFGQQNREEGWAVQRWQVLAGQRLNAIVNAPGHHWGRLWWKPATSQTWYLLPSQYWTGDGTARSEYGYDCRASAAPSYHTAFSRAVPAEHVPLFTGE